MARSPDTSAGAAPQQDDGNGLEQNLPVKGGRPVVYVLEVQFHDAAEPESVAPFKSPKAGEARRHAQAAPLPTLVLLHFLRQRWARAYERHIAPQDVKQLRHFVQAE